MITINCACKLQSANCSNVMNNGLIESGDKYTRWLFHARLTP